MIKAWRISKAKHKKTAFTGTGTQFASGRWHHLNVPVVYGADSLALAALEQFVHVTNEAIHIRYVSFELDIPPSLIIRVEDIASMPPRWRKQPPGQKTMAIGSNWVKSGQSAVFSVPSAIILTERVFVLNPNHPDFRKINIGSAEKFSFDSRIWK